MLNRIENQIKDRKGHYCIDCGLPCDFEDQNSAEYDLDLLCKDCVSETERMIEQVRKDDYKISVIDHDIPF